MKQISALSTLLSVCALASCALVGNNRYGAPHNGNSLHYRGANRYSAGPHAPVAPKAPVHQAYAAPRNSNYGSHQPAAPYGGARHLSAPAAPAAPHYSRPGNFAGPVSYGQHSQASIPSQYSSSKRSVFQQHQHNAPSYSAPSRTGYSQPQTYSQSHQSAESRSQTHGREMKYTIRDPHNRGTTHVSETHVVSNRQMHGAEAEAAMKKLMGSMGPGSDGGFQDLVKGIGLPFY